MTARIPSQVPQAVAFHPSTNQLIVASKGASGGLFSVEYRGGSLALLNLLLGNPSTYLKDSEQRQFSALAFSPDETAMVSGEIDGTMRIWNTATWEGKEIRAAGTSCSDTDVRNSRVVALGYSGDGNLLLAAFQCGLIEVWDMEVAPKPAVSWNVGSPIARKYVAMSGDGSRIAVRLSPDGPDGAETVQVRLLSDGQLHDPYDGPIEAPAGNILVLGFDADNRLVVGTSHDRKFSLVYHDADDRTMVNARIVEGVETNSGSKAVLSRYARIVGVTDARQVLRFVNLDNGQRDSLRAVDLANAFFNPNGLTLVVAKGPNSPIFTREWRLLHLTAFDSAGSPEPAATNE